MSQALLKHEEMVAHDHERQQMVPEQPDDLDILTEYGPRRPQMTVLIQTQRGKRKYTNYPSRTSKTLGEFQIAMGVIAAILNGIGLFLQLNRQYINVTFYFVCGIWGFVFFCLSGSFGIAAAKRKTPCPIITHMVLAIFGGTSGLIVAAQGAGGLAREVIIGKETGHLNTYDTSREHQYVMATMVLCVGLMICGLTECVTCLWSASLCCKAACCGSSVERLPDGAFLTDAGQPMLVVNGRGQTIINANQQTGMVDSEMGLQQPPPYSPM